MVYRDFYLFHCAVNHFVHAEQRLVAGLDKFTGVPRQIIARLGHIVGAFLYRDCYLFKLAYRVQYHLAADFLLFHRVADIQFVSGNRLYSCVNRAETGKDFFGRFGDVVNVRLDLL